MATHKSTWKDAERFIASWFDSRRNVLSGSNGSIDDGGNIRHGDVIYAPALIEVKLRDGNAGVTRAEKTKREAATIGKPWLHVELTKGSRDIVSLVLDAATAENVVRLFLRPLWERKFVARSEYLTKE